MISAKTHSLLDYLVGILLIAAPWLFGFDVHKLPRVIMVALGIFTLLYSLLTDYKYSLINILPFKVHLAIDALSAIFLIASPWIFRFSKEVYWPHIIVGMVEIIIVLLTLGPARTQT